jgi:cyclic pyranopterin phosphate synthase
MIAPAALRQSISLRISVTEQCQLRCPYCMPPEGLPAAPRTNALGAAEILRFVRFVGRHFSLAKVRLTGGEPLLRRDLPDILRALAAQGVPDLALTTNGQSLAAAAAGLRRAGLRRVNVHLDTLDAEKYRVLTRGGRLSRVLAGIEAARREGLAPVKLNVVVLRGVNDGEVAAMARFGLRRGCEVRFLEVMPIGLARARHGEWFVSAAEVRRRLAGRFGLEPLPAAAGCSSRRFLARGGGGCSGVLGFISPCSEPFCADCRRLRLTSTGRLLGCLARGEGPDLAPILRALPAGEDGPLLEAVEAALRLKRRPRRFADQRLMATVGG